VGAVVALWGAGVFLHFVSEILIYAAFGRLAQHWLPLLVVAAWVAGFSCPT
jgi:hypothetical protein